MAYTDFRLEEVLEKFSLSLVEADLFHISNDIHPSRWLFETLAKGRKFAQIASSEKAKSEFIIAPTLLEIESHYPEQIAIYSGKNLDAERANGLYGECDFIIGKGAVSAIITTPIIAMVEAKRDNLENGLGQCAAQMYGAILYNKKHNYGQDALTEKVYGCVTTGDLWQFMKLENKLLTIDRHVIYLNELDRILSCFNAIIAEFL
jgi:hypothetical protein